MARAKRLGGSGVDGGKASGGEGGLLGGEGKGKGRGIVRLLSVSACTTHGKIPYDIYTQEDWYGHFSHSIDPLIP